MLQVQWNLLFKRGSLLFDELKSQVSNSMNIFISWAGKKSKHAAQGLKALIERVDKRHIAWFSDEDMMAGGEWRGELIGRLKDSHFGILCITQESLESSWLLFEAGALSTGMAQGKVCPYLIDVERQQLSEPLALFQSKEATKEQSRDLIMAINYAMGLDALPEQQINSSFEENWLPFELLLRQLNYDLTPLPKDLRERLLDELCDRLLVEEAEMYAMHAGVSTRFINWNQALYYVLDDIVRVAIDEQTLMGFVDYVADQRPASKGMQTLRHEVRSWTDKSHISS
ncbi:MAG: toll/interleukin-1 receptor domain-containing protein [Anaerolineales bacterium]|nr:toll/interleukin-1 receptor domain-containing protein [Anaerolineales bacterium]